MKMFLQIKSMPKLSPEPFIAQTSVYIMQLKLAHFPFKIGSLESSDATFVFLAAFFLVKMKGPPKREEEFPLTPMFHFIIKLYQKHIQEIFRTC